MGGTSQNSLMDRNSIWNYDWDILLLEYPRHKWIQEMTPATNPELIYPTQSWPFFDWVEKWLAGYGCSTGDVFDPNYVHYLQIFTHSPASFPQQFENEV